MKTATTKALDQLEAAHDWEEGQTWGHGGTCYSRTDHCRLCGMTRQWDSDRQNGIAGAYRQFQSRNGRSLSLLEAIREGCING